MYVPEEYTSLYIAIFALQPSKEKGSTCILIGWKNFITNTLDLSLKEGCKQLLSVGFEASSVKILNSEVFIFKSGMAAIIPLITDKLKKLPFHSWQ